MLAAYTVNVDFDEADGILDGQISLRDAIQAAAPSGDTIDFAPNMNGATIDLTLGTQIEFGKSLTIDASMLEDGITIDADDPSSNPGDGIRIFNITDPTNGTSPPVVTLIGFTLTGADPAFSGGTLEGGAIRSAGILTLRNMNIVDNEAYYGAGVFLAVAGGGTARDVLTIDQNTHIEQNSAEGDGGGVYVRFSTAANANDTARISGSVLSHNTAGQSGSFGSGGALYLQSSSGSTHHAVIVTATTFEANEADSGGAIFNLSNAPIDLSILQESSISGNSSTDFFGAGGGIHSHAFGGAILRVEDSTISGNTSASDGGGLFVLLNESSALVVENSEISGNTASDGDGGGIFAWANSNSDLFPTPRAITISRSLISGNTAYDRGGGVYTRNFDGTETLIEETRVMGNHVPNSAYGVHKNGGGIYAYVWGDPEDEDGIKKPKFTITGSTVDNNDTYQKGGGIFVCSKHNGYFVATNSTLSGNRTTNASNGAGGGIFIAHPAVIDSVDAFLRNITVTQNVSKTGGGVETLDAELVNVQLANSIVSENFSDQSKTVRNNLVGRLEIAAFTHNLIGSGSTVRDHDTGDIVASTVWDDINIISDTPLLGQLQDNGGPTPTHVLLLGSAAIDAGSNSLASDPFTNVSFESDQRGTAFARVIDVQGVGSTSGARVDLGAFELLVGDYDRNGEVECADYVLWRATFGSTTDLRADGNGNSVIDAADYVVWANEYDAIAGGPIGDFDGDGETDMDDYGIWRSTFGSTSDLRADANCDGVVNAADYVIWRDTYKSKTLTPLFGLLGDMPPAVLGFALFASSNSFDFTGVIGSGEQLRSVPISGINSISITFNQAVTATQGALQLINLDGSAPSVTGFPTIAPCIRPRGRWEQRWPTGGTWCGWPTASRTGTTRRSTGSSPIRGRSRKAVPRCCRVGTAWREASTGSASPCWPGTRTTTTSTGRSTTRIGSRPSLGGSMSPRRRTISTPT